MKKTYAVLLVSLIVLMTALPLVSQDVSADTGEGDWVLFDHGDGRTEWTEVTPTEGMTVGQALSAAAADLGLELALDGDIISIDGRVSDTIGSASTGGNTTVSGTTGVTVTSSWILYAWDGTDWNTSSVNLTGPYDSDLAVAFYPNGTAPLETPEYRSSWTMVRGDSSLSGQQTAVYSEDPGEVAWVHPSRSSGDYVCSSILVVGQYAYVGYGGGYTADSVAPAYICYNRFTGDVVWQFDYSIGAGYETATGVAVGDYMYIPATDGHIYKIPLVEGPGEGDVNVESTEIPFDTGHSLIGRYYSTGPASMIVDSGVLYFGASNGMVYCYDLDLELIWSCQTDGCIYYSSLTAAEDIIIAGALDGSMYILDSRDGGLVVNESVYTTTDATGLVSPAVVFGDTIIATFSDGKGMNTQLGGVVIYTFNGTALTEVARVDDMGVVPTYLQPVEDDDFTGVYITANKGIYRMDTEGGHVLLNDEIVYVKSPPVLVNGDRILITDYNGGAIISLDLDGQVAVRMEAPSEVQSYAMSPVVVIDGWTYVGTDGGSFAVSGQLSSGTGTDVTDDGDYMWVYVLAAVLVLLAAGYLYLRFVKGVRRPLSHVMDRAAGLLGFRDPAMSHIRRNKRRLLVTVILGSVLAFAVFLLCLAYGPSGNLSLGETFESLISALQKGGNDLGFYELIIFESRLPRAMVAFAVGVGLSISGAVYQAIIRNPLVDPYIMGVSAGAGTAAVAAIAFNFTFFGLFSNSIYLTAVAAIVGGILAFAATMLIAEKSGGNSINYVLAGVVVGLAFSAVQSLMLSMAGHKVSNALAWLFGSFSNVSWDNALLVFIPAIVLSFIPLIWAKELNLVLLGEEQARQMGLDVRKFNRWMLILASVLAAVCVAFVGIIGFVGLVVPHLCRMVFGGDHRLVLPASMVLGGTLMMMADFAAKMLMVPVELPVGAITTIIGVPVFAYLLIIRGKMYDG